MAAKTPRTGRRKVIKFIGSFALGMLVLIGIPEVARNFHGGAFAQTAQSPAPPSVTGDCNVFGNGNNMNCPHNYYAPQPRSIDDPAAIAMVAGARTKGSHNFGVWLTGNDPDVGPYSARLIAILKNAGWTGDFAGSALLSFPPPQDTGLHLCGKATTPPASAIALLEVLVSNHVDVSRTYYTCRDFHANFDGKPLLQYDDDMVGIIVGRNGPSSP